MSFQLPLATSGTRKPVWEPLDERGQRAESQRRKNMVTNKAWWRTHTEGIREAAQIDAFLLTTSVPDSMD